MLETRVAEGETAETRHGSAAVTSQPKPVTTEIYLSRNIHAFAKVFDPSKPICLLFGNMAGPRSVFRPTLMKHAINFVFVSCPTPDWWQYPDLGEAERQLRAFVAPFPRRVTYGESMGGYGALLCSKAIGADLVLACSPQFTPKPGVPKGDVRWGHERTRVANELGFPNDDMPGRLTQTGEVIILYDPGHFDRHHVALIDQVRPTKKLYFPLAGHATPAGLRDLGMLSRLLTEAVSGELRLDQFQADLHAARRRRKAAGLVERLGPRSRPIPSGVIARMLEHDAPVNRRTLRTALIALVDADRPDLLVRIVTRLLLETDYAGEHLLIDCKKFAKPLVQAGLHEPVVAILSQARAAAPDEPGASSYLAAAYLSHLAGDKDAALDFAQTAGDLVAAWDPDNAAIAEFMDLIEQPDLARGFQSRALLSSDVSLSAFSSMAGAAQRRHDWPRVVEIWSSARDSGFGAKRVAFHLANALSKLGRFQDALAALDPLLEEATVAPSVRKLQGQCAIGLQRHSDAVEALRDAVASDPNDAVAHRMLSDCLHATGDAAGAKGSAERAQTLKPSVSNLRHLEKMTALAG